MMIVDLHALTVEHDPRRLRALTAELLATLLACGVDPDRALCYVQSDVPEHAQLHYLLECATGYGEAARMIQFREKSRTEQHVRLSLLTYPVLMAADILLHDAAEVPVGDDQTQHIELARDVANRFNTRYGRTFVVPRAVNPPVAARVMDLTDPTGKMGKSAASDAGTILLLDEPGHGAAQGFPRRDRRRRAGPLRPGPSARGVQPAGDPGRLHPRPAGRRGAALRQLRRS